MSYAGSRWCSKSTRAFGTLRASEKLQTFGRPQVVRRLQASRVVQIRQCGVRQKICVTPVLIVINAEGTLRKAFVLSVDLKTTLRHFFVRNAVTGFCAPYQLLGCVRKQVTRMQVKELKGNKEIHGVLSLYSLQ